ncbi:MAG: choice-of-anchor J domain-containing protein [Pseudobdellovibrionaceae bacterium]|nr:choice-of-anchor J domain-containing protein [Pseudobdellovibrionaceae bacterium]
MKTIRVMSLALALVCSPILTSCSDDSKNRSGQAEQVQSIEDLLAAVQTVEQDMAQGFLLKSATERDRSELKQNLFDLKISTYRLKSNPYDADALSQLYQAFLVYEKLNLLEDDRARLGGLDQQLRATLDSIATLQGKTLDGIERALFVKVFNYEIAPFSATKIWRIDGTRDKKYAIGDGKTSAWLMSPRLDLTQVGSPAFMVDQAINDRGLPFLDGVMYLVSQDYVSGDPEKATWESIKISSMPDGSSYNYRKSEAVSLKAYEGKKIVVAFKLDGEKLKFMPANAKSAWQIASFSLLGTGKVTYEPLSLAGGGAGNGNGDSGEPSGPARDLPLPYVKSFRNSAFTNFTIAPAQQPTGWTIFKYASGDSCCSKVGGSNTTSWLLSPRYDLSKVQNPQFFFRQAINKAPENASVISVMITTDESVADLSKVNWEQVTFTKAPNYNPKYVFEDTEKVDLSRYAGKKIVIAFKYQQGETTSWPTWEIDSLQILGNGTLSFDPVTVDTLGSATPTPTPNPEPTVPSLYKKVFKDTGLTEFNVETVGTATNGWNVFTIPGRTTPCCLKVAGSETTSWLASPRFDLTDVQKPQFWFRHTINKAPATADMITIWVTTDDTISSLATAQWEQVPVTKVPTYSPKFVFENSEVFDLSKYAGKRIVIGFRYQMPVATDYPSWQVDSLQLEGNGTLKMEPVVLTPPAG